MDNFNQPPKPPEETTEQREKKYIALIQELSEVREGFPFPGVSPEYYPELKAVSEEFPEYSTPIDELITKFQTQGMKIILSKDPKSGNVFILPLNSTDVEMDNLSPRHMMITEGMDERLKKLILANKELKNRKTY